MLLLLTRPDGIVRATHSAESELDLRAELDHAVGRNLEELGGTLRVARHDPEQLLAPARHTGAAGGNQTLAAEEEGHLVWPKMGDAALFAVLEDLRDVRRLHEAIARDHAHEVLREPLDFDPLLVRHLGDFARDDR